MILPSMFKSRQELITICVAPSSVPPATMEIPKIPYSEAANFMGPFAAICPLWTSISDGNNAPPLVRNCDPPLAQSFFTPIHMFCPPVIDFTSVFVVARINKMLDVPPSSPPEERLPLTKQIGHHASLLVQPGPGALAGNPLRQQDTQEWGDSLT